MPETTSELELFTSEFFQTVHQAQVELRAQGPVREIMTPNGVRAWLITRYEEAKAMLADPTLRKNHALLDQMMRTNLVEGGHVRPFADELVQHMLNTDAPDHTRLRRMVSKAFTARRIEQLRPRVEQITEELLDAMAAGEQVDILHAFAFSLPIVVICEVLGVPVHDRDDFQRWAVTINGAAGEQQTHEASTAMVDYFARLIALKREQPGEDMLSALIAVREDDDRLSESELISMAFLLLIAGHETTGNMIGNGILALLTNPDQLAALKADPSLLPGAIEEFMRFDGPVNVSTFRITTAPVEIGGVPIPANSLLIAGFGSANRDENRFAGADRLDITRQHNSHLGFGHGAHYCLGAQLARLEAEIAFRGLLDRYPSVRLDTPVTELRWHDSMLIHGVKELLVRL